MSLAAQELIKKHEGLRLQVYTCPAGKQTIGYGRNLEDTGITKTEAEIMLHGDIERCEDELKSVFGDKLPAINEARQAALIDLLYNLGLWTFLKFKNFIAAVKAEDWEKAGVELLDSRYAQQVPNRANRIKNIIVTGVIEEKE